MSMYNIDNNIDTYTFLLFVIEKQVFFIASLYI